MKNHELMDDDDDRMTHDTLQPHKSKLSKSFLCNHEKVGTNLRNTTATNKAYLLLSTNNEV